MDRRHILKLAGFSVIFPRGYAQPHTNALSEYCFQISPTRTIAMSKIDITPVEFLKQNPNLEAVINGIYFGDFGEPLGLAYMADGHHFATEMPRDIRGYFSVNRNGNEIQVSEKLSGALDDYWIVIGTHPLLVVNGEPHAQSMEARYSRLMDYRSAIGTKGDNNICFAVSTDKLLIQDWARILKESGYQGAINLDGGPKSQLAVNENGTIRVSGPGTENTRLVIFSQTRNH